MRHDFFLWATIVALMAVEECAGIVCYYCTIQPPHSRSNQTAQLCSMFDYSNHYHKDCPLSTLCMKRTFQLELQQGKKVTVSERGCANQARNEQVYRNGKWQMENKIEDDIYRVGCEQSDSVGLQSTTEYCYCATNLCNSAEGHSLADHIDTMAIIVVFNILKCIQSLS